MPASTSSFPADRPQKRNGNDVVNEILATFKIMLTRPSIFMLLGGLAFLLATSGTDFKKGPIVKYCNESSRSNTSFCKFFKAHPRKLFGMLACIPVSLDLRGNTAWMFLAVSAGTVFILDEVPVIMYVFILCLAHAFFTVKTPQARGVIAASAALAYYFEVGFDF